MCSENKQRCCLRCDAVFTPDSKYNFLCPACVLAVKTMGGDYLADQAPVKSNGGG